MGPLSGLLDQHSSVLYRSDQNTANRVTVQLCSLCSGFSGCGLSGCGFGCDVACSTTGSEGAMGCWCSRLEAEDLIGPGC